MNQAEINDYIVEKGLIKTHIARKAGIQEARFSRILHNKSKINADEYEKLCALLDVPLEMFMHNPKKTE